MKKGILLIVIAAALVAGCGEKGKESGKVLKKVGKEVITEAQVQKEIDNLPPQYKSYYNNEEGKKNIVDRLVEQKILKQVAEKQNLSKDKDYVKDLETSKEKLLAQYAVKRNVLDKVQASDTEIAKEYETKKESYKQGAEVKASHILLRVTPGIKKEDKAALKAKADGILKQALDGADFAELAKKNSEDGSASNGGDLGWFAKDRMVKEFADASFAGEKGKVYPQVVETQFGFHIIKVTDKKEAGYKDISEVKDQIKEEILNKKRIEEFNKWMETLKKDYLKDDSAKK